MATYYPTSNNQREAAPMLYLREPMPNQYPESPVLPSSIMMYSNYASSSMAENSEQQNCVEIPSMGASGSTQPSQEILSNLGSDYNGWRDGRNEMLLMQPMASSPQNRQVQGLLSLSLGTQIPSGLQMPQSDQFRNPNSAFFSFLSPQMQVAAEEGGEDSTNERPANAECLPPAFHEGNRNFPPAFHEGNQNLTRVDPSVYSMPNMARAVSNSKYLKAAQQLLDEVVHVWKALKSNNSEKKVSGDSDPGLKSGAASSPSVDPQESDENSRHEISAADRQDLQNKLTKLLTMLDEVDRQYKQYYHQMQIVVSSFDSIAGYGAAKPYTALALQRISCHFRCLRDAITGQIRVTRKNLGEQDSSSNGNGVGISRLRYVDQQLRQQRTLHQLGMMQQHTWRPQRGLPETSVTCLRAWLFEHFLHPYPKDSDKIMLARQTGLSRGQVSNWFINARVRLWKPMVEEMYKEETGDMRVDSNSSSENASKETMADPQTSEDRGPNGTPAASMASTATHQHAGQIFDSISNHILPGSITAAPFQNESCYGDVAGVEYRAVKFSGEQQQEIENDRGHFQMIGGAGGSGGGISLTLGLRHCEGATSLPLHGGACHDLDTLRGDGAGSYDNVLVASSARPGMADFQTYDQHRFGSSHLLRDFVADYQEKTGQQ